MAPRLMDQLSDVVLCMAVPLDKLAIAFRLLDCVQVFALNVLDQRDLGRGRIVDLSNDRRNRVQPSTLGGTPSPLPRDDLESVTMRAEENRLQNAALGNRIGEFVDRLFFELHTRLIWVGPNAAYLDLSHAA